MRTIAKPLVDGWISRRWRQAPDTNAQSGGARPAALVTGATAGIGHEIARLLAARGHDLVLVARSSENLGRVAQTLRDMAPAARIAIIPLDLTAADAVQRIEDALQKDDVYVDILVNNAGVGLAGPYVDHAPDEIENLMTLNMNAAAALMRAFLPGMLARGKGGVINIASLGALTPGPHQAAYYASKAFLVSLTRAIAWEIRGQGVRICAVAPGPVETGFHASMDAEGALYRTVLPSMSPARVAKSALFGYDYGRTFVVPGLLNRLTALPLHILPPTVLAPIIAILLRKPDAR